MNFTQKLGPLPVWAWAALAVGGYVVLRLRKSSTPAATNQLYGGELGPDNAPGYPGNFALNPGSLAPSSALPVTNNPISTTDPTSVPTADTSTGAAGTGTTANAPQVALPNIFSPYGIYTGQPGFTPGVPVHFPK